MSAQNVRGMYKDEAVIRITATEVVVLSFIILFAHWQTGAVILSLDFGIRAFTTQHSLLSLIAKTVSRFLNTKPKPVFAAPKRFAALIGFICSTTIFALLHFNLFTEAYIIGGILIFFAFLEAAFNICVGCYIYNFIIAPLVNR